MRKMSAFLFEHLVGAFISFGIALVLFDYGRELAQSPGFNEHLVELYLLFGFLSVGLLAGIIWLVHHILRWITFRIWLGEAKVCGLYVEAYFTQGKKGDRIPVIALMIVHFDLGTGQYQICGHSFVRDQKSKELVHHAHWRTLASHDHRKADDCGIFYVHRGFLAGETTEMRGTTFCDLPFSVQSYRGGSFCDLEVPKLEPNGVAAAFPAVKFEVVRALDRDINDFRIGMPWPTRWKCYLSLGSPSEGYFISFVQKKGRMLIEHPDRQGTPRGGELMREVWAELAP
ncbi:MAG TPA: hypothetical protein VKW08_24685 [Xanthobacteraceae bacterium]|nr:hypothetical protein [Xanthobacteraceae bacterium]